MGPPFINTGADGKASWISESSSRKNWSMLQSTFNGDSNWRLNVDSSFWPGKQRKNMVWVTSDGKRPVIARRNKTVNKTTYAISFNGHGPVFQVPVPKVSSETGQFYKEQVLENSPKSTQSAACARKHGPSSSPWQRAGPYIRCCGILFARNQPKIHWASPLHPLTFGCFQN